MQIPTVKLSEATQATFKKILKASKEKKTFGQQMQMASYYAFLHSEKQAKTDTTYYAKILMGK